MSNSKQTTKAKILAAIAAKKAAVEKENAQMVRHAREEAVDIITKAQREADVLIGNTTFRNIFFVHNNIIHDVQPNKLITPFVPSSFESGAKRQYEAALTLYYKKLKDYRPVINYWVTVEKRHPIWRTITRERVLKKVPNPRPAPIRPAMPKDKENKLNAAVADIIVDMPTQTMFWGRWATPFRVYAMSLETKKIEPLYECRKPVTSVALGPQVAEGADPMTRDLYWMEGNEWIMKGNLKGDPRKNFLNITAPDRGGLWQMEVDAINNRIYWTNDISIWRADIEGDTGTNVLMVISPSESPFPIDLAVDGYNGYLYWMDQELKRLRKSDLEGVFLEDLYDIKKPTRGLKVDPNANLMYWSDQTEMGHALRRGDTQTKVVRLDGKDDFIEIPSFAPGDTFTVEMWVNPDTTKDQQCFLGKHTSRGANIFLIGYYENHLIVNYNNKTYHLESDKIMGHHHLAVVVSKNNGKPRITLYRNGEKTGKQINVNKKITKWDQQPWFIGKDIDNTTSNDFFDGGVSELRIWNGTRTAVQIRTERFKRLHGREKNLLGYWRADERQGEILPDLTPYGNFAIIHRELHLQPDLGILSFDGKTNSIDLDPMEQSFKNGLSFEFWVKFNKGGTWPCIVNFGNGPGKDNIFVVSRTITNNAGKKAYNMGIFIQPFEDSAVQHAFEVWESVELKKWMHFAITLDPNGQVHIYKNGLILGSSIKGSEVALPRDVSRSLNYIGKSSIASHDNFDGQLTDLRMWDRPLTEQEVRTRMHQRLTGNEDHLIGYWPIHEGSGELVKDHSRYARHGKIADPKSVEKARLIVLQKDKKLLAVKWQEQKNLITSLTHQIDQRKNLEKSLKRNKQSIDTLAKQKKEIDSLKAVQEDPLKKWQKQAKDTSTQLVSLNTQKASLQNQHQILIAQRNSLQASNIFGTLDHVIRQITAQINKNRAAFKGISATSNTKKLQLKEIDAKIKDLQKNLNQLNHRLQTIQQEEKFITNENTATANQLIQLNRSIGDKKLSAQKSILKEYTQQLNAIETELTPLIAQFSENVSKLWVSEFSPVNHVLPKHYEVDTITHIPSLDGLELVHAMEYAKAKRKKAFDALHRAREKGAREKAIAQRQAQTKIKAGEKIKKAQQKAADKIEAKAKLQAANDRKSILNNKKEAERKATKDKALAKRNKDQRIREATRSANATKAEAQRGANKKVKAARHRKNAAQVEVNRANAEKSDKMG